MQTFEDIVNESDVEVTTKGFFRWKDVERLAKEYAKQACEEQRRLCDIEVENGCMASEAPLPELK